MDLKMRDSKKQFQALGPALKEHIFSEHTEILAPRYFTYILT